MAGVTMPDGDILSFRSRSPTWEPLQLHMYMASAETDTCGPGQPQTMAVDRISLLFEQLDALRGIYFAPERPTAGGDSL